MISLIGYSQDNRGSEKVGIGGKQAADAFWPPGKWLVLSASRFQAATVCKRSCIFHKY